MELKSVACTMASYISLVCASLCRHWYRPDSIYDVDLINKQFDSVVEVAFGMQCASFVYCVCWLDRFYEFFRYGSNGRVEKSILQFLAGYGRHALECNDGLIAGRGPVSLLSRTRFCVHTS